jgi:hypothetical protein
MLGGINKMRYEPGDFDYPDFSTYAFYFLFIGTLPIDFVWTILFMALVSLFKINKDRYLKLFCLSFGITFLGMLMFKTREIQNHGFFSHAFFKETGYMSIIIPSAGSLIFLILYRLNYL